MPGKKILPGIIMKKFLSNSGWLVFVFYGTTINPIREKRMCTGLTIRKQNVNKL